MRRVLFCAMISFLVLGSSMVGSEAQAAVVLSLASSENLTALPIGQDVWFEVQLSGLDVANGQKLSRLAVIVGYTGIAADTFNIVPGTIIPTAGVTAGYFTVPSPPSPPAPPAPPPPNDEVSATYDATDGSGSDHIAKNDVFFKFKTKVHTAGSGTFAIEYVDAADESNVTIPPSEISMGVGSLSFQASNTPEPATWVLLAAACATLGPYYLWKRRRSLSALTRPSHLL